MIDYTILGNSVKHYRQWGFHKIEVPWYVPIHIDEITNPCKSFRIDNDNDKCIVGSAEQGFLYLYYLGRLNKGMYQSITPCYRVEDIYDSLHQMYFMKNELIITDDVRVDKLHYMIKCAMNFFESYDVKVDVVETSKNAYDIQYEGIELGSYGIRECEFLTWIYGTGCAEPRFSSCLRR